MKTLIGWNVAKDDPWRTRNGLNMIALQFKIEDAWVGLFWRTTRRTHTGQRWIEIWFCPIPFFPIYVNWLTAGPRAG